MAYDFDKIACSYDRLNRIMSLGLDRWWRKSAVKGLHGSVLDVACGTGDMASELCSRGCTVVGVDLSEEMLAIARRKVVNGKWEMADAENLPFEDGSFDAVTCAFGVRNFVHLEQGLSEMLRVLKPGGTMVILELATPDCAVVKPFYRLYTRHIIPWLGSRIAGNREAYTYLPASIDRFPKGEAFIRIVEGLGGRTIGRRLTFGVCRLYVTNKEAAR